MNQNVIQANLLNTLENDYQHYQEFQYFYDNEFLLVLKVLNKEKDQEIGLIINDINKCEKITSNYVTTHEINNINKEIQFSQIIGEKLIRINNDSAQQDQIEAFLVQEVEVINIQKYNKENYKFLLEELDESNYQQVRRFRKQRWQDINSKENLEDFLLKVESCKRINNFTFEQDYCSISNENLLIACNQISKILNLVELTIIARVEYLNENISELIQSLSNLKKLTKLTLQINTFQQDQLLKIDFSPIGNFSNLSCLDLSIRLNCQELQNIESLCTGISKLKQLTQLKLSIRGCSINDEGMCKLIQGITNCQDIYLLALNLDLETESQQWAQFFQKLCKQLIYIKELDLTLGQFSFSNEGVNEAISSLHQCKLLSNLTITCQFSNCNINLIGKEIAKIQSLSIFNFHFVRSNKEDIETKGFLYPLVECKNLKEIVLNFRSYIQNNDLLWTACHLLSKNKTIEKIELNIEGEEICKSKDSYELEEITNLKYIKMYLGVKFSGNKLAPFTFFLQKCVNLQVLKLDVSNSQIEVDDLLKLGYAIKQMKVLTNFGINLSFNEIACDGIQEFTESISQIQSLKSLKLKLRHCEISIPHFENVAKLIAKCTNLQRLYLIMSSVNLTTAKTIGKIIQSNSQLNILKIGLCQEYGKSCKNLTPPSQMKMLRLVKLMHKTY